MILNRTYRYNTSLSMEEIRKRLLGKHLTVHKLNFEITERDDKLKVIPQAEDDDTILTLPITHVEMQGKGSGGTRVTLISKPRKIDAGGPYLIMIFCLFCVLGASLFYLFNGSSESYLPPLTMFCIGLVIFMIFWFRMETGYFDYTRKIKKFIKQNT